MKTNWLLLLILYVFVIMFGEDDMSYVFMNFVEICLELAQSYLPKYISEGF